MKKFTLLVLVDDACARTRNPSHPLQTCVYGPEEE